MRPRNLSGGLRGLQTGSESIRRVSVWSSHKKRDQGTFLVGSEACKPQVKTSDVFLCGLQPKIIPRNPVCGLRGLEAGSESIRRVSVRSSPKVIPRDRFLRAIAEIFSARLSFQFNSRNFGLLSDCVSAARCVSKCRGHDFGSHAAVELLPGT